MYRIDSDRLDTKKKIFEMKFIFRRIAVEDCSHLVLNDDMRVHRQRPRNRIHLFIFGSLHMFVARIYVGTHDS